MDPDAAPIINEPQDTQDTQPQPAIDPMIEVQRLVDEEKTKWMAEIAKRDEVINNQKIRAEKAEAKARKQGAEADELGEIKEQNRLLLERTEQAEERAKMLERMTRESAINGAVAFAASKNKLVNESATKSLKYLIDEQVKEIDGKVCVVQPDGTPRRKMVDGLVVNVSVEELTEQILQEHTYLLAASNRGGTGDRGNRAGLTRTAGDIEGMSEKEQLKFFQSQTDEQLAELQGQL